MRFAYADPPYLGKCSAYGHRHEEPWGCWDGPESHGALSDHLAENFEGWAYSLSSPSLRTLRPLLKAFDASVRIAAWVKPFASFKPTQRVAYAWEPVVFIPGREVGEGA